MGTARKPGQTLPQLTPTFVFYGILTTPTAPRRPTLVCSHLCIFIFVYANRYSAETSGFSGYATLCVFQIIGTVEAFIKNGTLFKNTTWKLFLEYSAFHDGDVHLE